MHKISSGEFAALRDAGYRLLVQSRLAESLAVVERLLQISANDLPSRLLMGRLCLRLQQAPLAEVHFRHILKSIPASEAARSGLVDVCIATGRMDEAARIAAAMLAGNGDSEVALLAAARLAETLRDDTAALAHYDHLLRLRPAAAAAQYNRSMLLLRLGRFSEGWAQYEQRFAAQAVPAPACSGPHWDGSPIGHLLVEAEQGLGDTIQFARFLRAAAGRAQRITLACPASLTGLLGRCLAIETVALESDGRPPHDAWLPLMSLPHVLQLGDATLAPAPRYLRADPPRSQRWRDALAGDGARFRVGIVHATSVAHPTESAPSTRRSCAASGLRTLATIPGLACYNLMLGPLAAQARLDFPELREPPGQIHDFEDSAALVDVLDAIVCVDTAIAHLAAALGRPTLLLLPYAPTWRWMRDTRSSPWYDSIRVFAQTQPGNWEDVLAGAMAQIRAMLAGRDGGECA